MRFCLVVVRGAAVGEGRVDAGGRHGGGCRVGARGTWEVGLCEIIVHNWFGNVAVMVSLSAVKYALESIEWYIALLEVGEEVLFGGSCGGNG